MNPRVNFWKKILFGIMALCLVWGFELVLCEKAHADYWEATASLLPGTYMLFEIDTPKTVQLQYYKAMGREPIQDATGLDVIEIWGGAKINITAENNSNGFVKWLNDEPMTSETYSPILLFWNEVLEKWQVVPFPCRYVKGDTT